MENKEGSTFSLFWNDCSMQVVVEIVPRGYHQISFLQPLREHQRSKGISHSKTLVVIV
jgi:hypothetical protein